LAEKLFVWRKSPSALNSLLKNDLACRSLTSAKAASENNPVMAAVNRWATQKQGTKSSFQQTFRSDLTDVIRGM
jgi:hypothetical protein